MRRRSNAIHSETEQQYMMLAQFSHEKAGYFYDEKFREEVDRKINKHRQTLTQGKAIQKQEKQKELMGFDYNPEQQARMQEEIEIGHKSKRKEVVLAVTADQVEPITCLLNSILSNNNVNQSQEDPSQQERTMDLFIMDHSETLLKIWIIKHSHINNALYQTYLKHALKVIDLTHHPNEIHKCFTLRAENAISACLKEVGWQYR